MGRAVQVDFLIAGLTDTSGQPLAGGKVYTYEAGTTTPVSLYTIQDKSASAANPIVLDSVGRASIWGDGTYKFVIKNSADVTQLTIDNVQYLFPEDFNVYCGLSTGAGTAYNLSPTPAETSLSDGALYSFIANHSQSGVGVSITISGLGSKSCLLIDGTTAPNEGDILSGGLYQIQYILSSDHFRLLNPNSQNRVATNRGIINYGGGNISIDSGLSELDIKYDGTTKWTFKFNGKLVPASPPDYTISSFTTRRTLNPATATAQQCADAINTLFDDLITLGFFQ